MKLKIGYLYKDRTGDIFIITKNNSVDELYKTYPYSGRNINTVELTYYFYTDTGKYNHTSEFPLSLDLVEEIGKAEDNPEYFL